MSDAFKINTVMSIDDDSLDQILYKRVMNRSGLVENIITFQLAEDALAYLKADECEDIDVILLDINMPRMSGFDFLKAATKDLGPEFSQCVVIMLTTSLDPEDKERAAEFDVVKAYMDKPLAIDDLKTIAKLLHQGPADPAG